MKKILSACSLIFISFRPVHAQIVAAPHVQGIAAPTVLQTASGLPLVDIVTPSAAGVSRNQFQQFDIHAQGAILNNGRTASLTQTGGWVAANPWLATGAAKVILNEIRSSNPSALNGTLEIAGSKAELIIANPAGITCNGCGFINASRLQLATGTPQLDDGRVSGFTIGDGSISIDGKGMNASQVDYTTLISRAVSINAKLWANQLTLRLGQAAADNNSPSVMPPSFALDVAQLGGMYAGKIWLIGNEHGVGVRNAGTVAATDELIVTVDGRLENRGSMDARHLQLTVPVLDNLGSGRIIGDIVGIAAEHINNIGETIASPVIAANTALDIGVKTLINQDHALLFSAADLRIGGALDQDGHATGIADNIQNSSASIEALGDMHIATHQFTNSNAHYASNLEKISGPVDQFYLQPAGAADKLLATHFRWEPWSRAGRYRWKTDTSSIKDGELGFSPIPGVDEEICTGAAGSETCTPLANALYPRTDPAWLYFGLTAPDTEPAAPAISKPPAPDASVVTGSPQQLAYIEQLAAYDSAQLAYTKAHDAWQTTTANRRDALDQSINSYNAGFAATYFTSWTQFYVSHTELESKVTQSDPANLTAGGKLTLQGESFTNDKSRIIVGGALSGDLNNLTNIDAIGQHVVQESGTSQFTRSRWRGGFKRYHQRDWGPVLAYEPADVITSFALPVMEYRYNHLAPVQRDDSDPAHSALSALAQRTADEHNSLFTVSKGNSPLLETDPRFTQYRQWLGSDSMLRQMTSDPAIMQKRLGDGFIEQKLVREQIAQLTGRRFLEGYASDEAEYAALMNSGVSYAKVWQLRPGIGLSSEQVAQLTSDMVWLVEQTISIAGKDGQPPTLQKVLVPKIYLVPREGDLHADGSLIAADQIDLHLNGELNNSGTIAGRTVVRIEAEKINNIGGEIEANTVLLNAASDINNIGGSVHAESNLAVHAGRDININSTTHSSRIDTLSSSTTSAARTNQDRVASLYVTGTDGTLTATASRDINLQGAQVSNAGEGNTVLYAGRDVNLSVVATSHRTASTDRHDTANYLRESSTGETGSDIHANGPLAVLANRDIHAEAASVVSEKNSVEIAAGGDIAFTAGESTKQTAQGTKLKTRSVLSSTTITTREEHDSSHAVESTISGDTVNIHAGHDLQVKGSQIVSDKGTGLVAANNIVIESSTETAHDSAYRHKKSSGLLAGNGLGYTIGTRTTDTTQQIDSSTEHGSAVGSLNGNVEIKAGNHYQQSASNVIAPAGSVNIDASAINITAATESSNASQQSRSKQTGITVAVSTPVISAVQTVSQLAKAARNTSDSRTQALAVAAAALTVANTAAAAQSGSASGMGMTASFSVGTSRSSASSNQQSETAAPSVLAAGRDVNLQASGAGQDSTLTVHGSQIMAANNATLLADGALQLDAQANTAIQTSKNHSSSASVGLTASVGADGMKLGVTVAASLGRGHADGEDLAWTNTQVVAGHTATLQSGGDTTLKGAVVTAQRVNTEVGGNLQIQSLQDTSTYESKQQNVSGSATFGPASGGNLSASQSQVDSTYTSVTEQSGIKAGDDGFGVQVNSKTDLQGGVISSTEAAVQANQNTFTTTALATSDLQNHASYSANATGISVGAGVSTDGRLAPRGTGVGIGHDSDSDSSITEAGISGVAGNEAVRTGNKPTGIAKIFDAARVEKEINAQVFITQTFSREAPRAIASYADSQVRDLQQQAGTESDPARQAALQDDIRRWKEGGAYRVALHAASGGMAGNVGGAVGAGTVAAAAPLLDDWQTSLTDKLQAAGASESVAKAAATVIMQTTATGIGAVASGGSTQGAAAGLSTDANNRQLHHSEKDLIARKANGDKVAAERLTKAACFEIKCWAQFPEGSPLYVQSYVSPAEAAGLKQEIAWVSLQKINGNFIYTPFEKFTDGVAATTRLSSVNGQGTLNGQFISKPSQPFRSNDCVTAECAAGMGPFRGNNPPDYVSAQVGIYIANGGLAINLHNGDMFAQWAVGRAYPNFSSKPGVSVVFGNIASGGNADATSEFLKGGSATASGFYPIPGVPVIGIGGSLNHSYGGKTAVEYGISLPPGIAVNPAGYGFEVKQPKNQKE